VTGDRRSPEERLARQGLTLPDPSAAVAAFAPYVRPGSTVYVSGQIALRDGQLVTKGRLGASVDSPVARRRPGCARSTCSPS
jgi:enamine deaminase RidA (YjgF/YER057c/UK114 family)